MLRTSLIAAVMLAVATGTGMGQAPVTPWKAKNLDIFPKDISREQLVQRMREFSFALGVRCTHCHAGKDGGSFDDMVFDSDEKPAKRTARAMLRMVEEINTVSLAKLPSRAEPRVVVECATCHRGVELPKSLQTTLFEIVQTQGAAAAVAKYRELRADAPMGRYNFGEWEINELARRLTEAGKVEAAIAMLELNGEFYPAAAEIDVFIAERYLRLGDRDKALQRYRAAVVKAPQNEMAKQRLAELEQHPPE